ncbi:DUF2231 domain-containing protein [Oryzihumus sp.]|uniref:DUF2231 domain-containing protein n=1 Tax=Oryzihumus sp. TaxID=1968903 RepID=UPI002ED94955
MFDTVFGLPVHVLVVHAVVVLLPLMALVTMVIAFVPRWRARVAWLVVAADVAMVVVTVVARQSGEALQRRLGGQIAAEHAAMGKDLVWFALGLLAASVLVALTRDARGGSPRLAAALTFVAAALVTWWTIRVGHTGADAVWKGIIAGTPR